MKNKKIALFIIFSFVFIYYFLMMPKALSPYRDSGEFALDIWSMSVSHQPGYPLYNILARLFSLLPFGSIALKLNLFSALFGALTVAAVFYFLANVMSIFEAFIFSLILAFNFTLQTVSGVSEMYSLNSFFACALIFYAYKFSTEEFIKPKDIYLIFYLFALFMTNRMDILLLYPSFFFVLYPKIKNNEKKFKVFLYSFLFFLLGFSAYLYLYFRANSNPLINWSNPNTLNDLINVITRKSYGSTLDLISLNYKKGEMFFPNLRIYFKHLLKNLNIAILFIFPGFFFLYKNNRAFLKYLTVSFMITCPLFLFMANMPPNPHSLSIVEPYYIIPDIILIIFSAFGFIYLKDKAKNKAIYLLSISSVLLTFYLNFEKSYKNDLYITKYYAQDVFKSVDKDSILVAKKDVQLFSLWYYAYVEKMRPDLIIVAQGLSGAGWYQKSAINKMKEIYLLDLNSSDYMNWINLKKINNRKLYATSDCIIPEKLNVLPKGLVYEIMPDNDRTDFSILEKYSFNKIKKPYQDFFVYDIANTYAKSVISLFAYYMSRNQINPYMLDYLDIASSLDPDIPDIYIYKALYFSSLKNWNKALDNFKIAEEKQLLLIKLSEDYKSLKDVKDSLNKQISYIYLNLGVIYEKLGKRKESEENYLRSLRYDPFNYQAHYNMAILYWNIDKNRVKQELTETLRINPEHKEAKYYLGK